MALLLQMASRDQKRIRYCRPHARRRLHPLARRMPRPSRHGPRQKRGFGRRRVPELNGFRLPNDLTSVRLQPNGAGAVPPQPNHFQLTVPETATDGGSACGGFRRAVTPSYPYLAADRPYRMEKR